jgi:vesicle coat complex subunit
VALLSDADTEVRKNAVGALKELARYDRGDIREAQAIVPLVALLGDTDIEAPIPIRSA